jgi:hypothetical protein
LTSDITSSKSSDKINATKQIKPKPENDVVKEKEEPETNTVSNNENLLKSTKDIVVVNQEDLSKDKENSENNLSNEKEIVKSKEVKDNVKDTSEPAEKLIEPAVLKPTFKKSEDKTKDKP